MKIVAEFNSMEEIISFVKTFGVKTSSPVQDVSSSKVTITDNSITAEVIKDGQLNVEDKEIVSQESSTDEEIETASTSVEQEAEKEEVEEPKVSKEMVREILTKLIKAGKAQEAKNLTSKYGASRLPDLKEEYYAAVYKEAEALL
jgi:preprotein translocase subunit SecD